MTVPTKGCPPGYPQKPWISAALPLPAVCGDRVARERHRELRPPNPVTVAAGDGALVVNSPQRTTRIITATIANPPQMLALSMFIVNSHPTHAELPTRTASALVRESSLWPGGPTAPSEALQSERHRGAEGMRSRRAAAERLLKTARSRRIIGAVLVALGMASWVSPFSFRLVTAPSGSSSAGRWLRPASF